MLACWHHASSLQAFKNNLSISHNLRNCSLQLMYMLVKRLRGSCPTPRDRHGHRARPPARPSGCGPCSHSHTAQPPRAENQGLRGARGVMEKRRHHGCEGPARRPPPPQRREERGRRPSPTVGPPATASPTYLPVS